MPDPTDPQNQPGTGGETFTLPEKFLNKGPEDIARAYVELEKEYGKRADYDDLKRTATESQTRATQLEQAVQAWEAYRPHLEKIGWDVTKINQAVAAATQNGQQAPSMQQWAQEWSSKASEEQLPYLLQSVIAPLYQSAMQQYTQNLTGFLEQRFKAMQEYQGQKERLTFSMLKAALPDRDLDGIYKAAMEQAKQMQERGYDPFSAVLESTLTKQQQEQREKDLRKQIRAEIEQEVATKQSALIGGSRAITTGGEGRPKGKEASRQAALKYAREKMPYLPS